MKKALAILLSFAMLLTGCSAKEGAVAKSTEKQTTTAEHTSITKNETIVSTTANEEVPNILTETDTTTDEVIQTVATNALVTPFDTTSEEYMNSLGFTSLNDPDFMQYVEDTVYTDLVNQLDNTQYFVENVDTVYLSKEFIEELAFNSQENIYFGYKLSELDEIFQGDKYIFTLGENGETKVVSFEEYDNTYDQVIRNVAIGTGVILLCVTISVVTGGVGATAVSMVFAASAKSATIFALSSGAISGVTAGVVEGIQTHDFDKAIKAAALKGSEDFKWGAITGAVVGGATETYLLNQGTKSGLTMNEVAKIQKESKLPIKYIKEIATISEYEDLVKFAEISELTLEEMFAISSSTNIPIDVVKNFHTLEEANVYINNNLYYYDVNGVKALIRKIDLTRVDELGRTNLERMKLGNAPLDENGISYELHHVGQRTDSPLAILTQKEHDAECLHWNANTENPSSLPNWKNIKKQFWQKMSELSEKGII